MKFLRTGLIVTAISAFSLALYLSLSPEPPEDIAIKITPYQGAVSADEKPLSSDVESSSLVRVHYFVKVGDTLSNVFTDWKLPYGTAQKILEADLESLKLDTIKPGDHLELLLDSESKQLVELIYHESLVEQAVYTENDDGSFCLLYTSPSPRD